MTETRLYPMCCTSAYCDRVEPACRTCPDRKAKDDFTAWRERTGAVQLDPIWSPRFWTATEES